MWPLLDVQNRSLRAHLDVYNRKLISQMYECGGSIAPWLCILDVSVLNFVRFHELTRRHLSVASQCMCARVFQRFLVDLSEPGPYGWNFRYFWEHLVILVDFPVSVPRIFATLRLQCTFAYDFWRSVVVLPMQEAADLPGIWISWKTRGFHGFSWVPFIFQPYGPGSDRSTRATRNRWKSLTFGPPMTKSNGGKRAAFQFHVFML